MLTGGTSTLFVRRHDGYTWSILFNSDRSAKESGWLAGKMDPLIHQAVDQEQAWGDTASLASQESFEGQESPGSQVNPGSPVISCCFSGPSSASNPGSPGSPGVGRIVECGAGTGYWSNLLVEQTLHQHRQRRSTPTQHGVTAKQPTQCWIRQHHEQQPTQADALMILPLTLIPLMFSLRPLCHLKS